MLPLEKGTDYSVPNPQALKQRHTRAVDRAVCPLFEERIAGSLPLKPRAFAFVRAHSRPICA